MNKATNLRFYAQIFSILLVFLASGVAAQAAIVDRVTATVGDMKKRTAETFQLDIDEEKVPMKLPTDEPSATGYDFVEKLKIICMKGCISGLTYNEAFYDNPISVFRLSQKSPDLVTIWATESAYMIRIYHVGNGSITKVLDQGSINWPLVRVDDHGSLIVLLAPGLATNFPKPHVFQLWKWAGRRYRLCRVSSRWSF